MAALPMALSPLLISAARPPALDSISATCSLEESVTYAPTQTEGVNASYRRAAGGQTGREAGQSTQSGAAGNEVTAFVRDRWNAVRQLVRENPYFSNRTPAEQAQAEALCLAQIRADYEVLLAQADISEQPQIQPQIQPLPELGEVPSDGADSPAISPVPTVRPSIQLEQSQSPAIAPTVTPTVTPTEPLAPAVDPATIPTAQDPGTYMGPIGNPTPFDGVVTRTLLDFPDGNYRYIAGVAEERAYSNEELRGRGGAVFVLNKVGDTVTGDLLPRLGLPGICVTGTVSGDMITGAAYPYDTTDSLQDSVRQIGEDYEPYGSGALKIRRTRTEGNRLYYAGALLDLTEFTRINAGSSLPPANCQVGRTGGRDQG